MRAATIDHYGAPVRIADVPRPVPGKGEVLVRVEAVAVTVGDARIRSARFPRGFGLLGRAALGLRGPRRPILGVAFSGVVAEPGEGFAVGDEVSGMSGRKMGAHAEYVAAPVKSLTLKPAGLSHVDAAGLLFGGSTALHYLTERAGLRAGESVLVNGASGAVGTAAVQLAVHFGAQVTGVCSGANADLVASLGAQRVVDYTRTPLSESTERYDVVFDAVGNLTRADASRLLKLGGRLILAVASLADTVLSRGPVKAGPMPEKAEAFAALLAIADDGGLNPVTRVLGGFDALDDAYAEIDSGRKVGNLVVVP
ncbi:MAG: NAD(P)-dependent alcohol dehydrogenase [Gordonia sp. (in: high G+C Gram-positive bacteria)]